MKVSKKTKLRKFYRGWYVDAVMSNPRKKSPSEKTLRIRGRAVDICSELMGNPRLKDIDEPMLEDCRKDLFSYKFKRGENGEERTFAKATAHGYMQELLIVLKATGPKNGNMTRAGILDDPPSIYIEPLPLFPKDHWSIDDARLIVAAAMKAVPPRSWIWGVDLYRKLALASLALWFYTGHRATTYQFLDWSALVERADGWYLDIERSVKTGKPDRIAVHPKLLEAIEACRGIDETKIIRWPIKHRAVFDNHKRWQRDAGVTVHGIQAWRRLHSNQMAVNGLDIAKNVASSTLGHSSSTVTSGSYVNVENIVRLQLPDLW